MLPGEVTWCDFPEEPNLWLHCSLGICLVLYYIHTRAHSTLMSYKGFTEWK